jgi:predicted RNase H-like nuclease (RuvC/YqgF family)
MMSPSSSSVEEQQEQPREEVINYISLERRNELKRQANRDQNLEDIATTTYETTQQLERMNTNIEKLNGEVQSMKNAVESIALIMREYYLDNKKPQ